MESGGEAGEAPAEPLDVVSHGELRHGGSLARLALSSR